jgi:hypothetical protein
MARDHAGAQDEGEEGHSLKAERRREASRPCFTELQDPVGRRFEDFGEEMQAISPHLKERLVIIYLVRSWRFPRPDSSESCEWALPPCHRQDEVHELAQSHTAKRWRARSPAEVRLSKSALRRFAEAFLVHKPWGQTMRGVRTGARARVWLCPHTAPRPGRCDSRLARVNKEASETQNHRYPEEAEVPPASQPGPIP